MSKIKIISGLIIIIVQMTFCSCATFQEKISEANKEIDSYTFERCARVRMQCLAASMQREGAVYLFSKHYMEESKTRYRCTVIAPCFRVEFKADSDAVVMLKLLEEADCYDDKGYISLFESETTILNYLVKDGFVEQDESGANYYWNDHEGIGRRMKHADFINCYINNLCNELVIN